MFLHFSVVWSAFSPMPVNQIIPNTIYAYDSIQAFCFQIRVLRYLLCLAINVAFEVEFVLVKVFISCCTLPLHPGRIDPPRSAPLYVLPRKTQPFLATEYLHLNQKKWFLTPALRMNFLQSFLLSQD